MVLSEYEAVNNIECKETKKAEDNESRKEFVDE